jgi:hypothetical protein
LTHDYTNKGGVVHTEILLPGHAPEAYADRAVLWNAVEMGERNRNAQLAREIELALPVELSREQNMALVRAYVNGQFVAAGMCADICMHDKNDGNPHAHVMLTMRPINEDGSWAAKSRKEYILDEKGERIRLKNGVFKTRKVDITDWNDQSKAEEWREGWAKAVNAALEQQGIAERIDHRSHQRQGVEQVPTVHLGAVAFQMEKRGIRTERGDKNRDVEAMNQCLRQLKARITKLQHWLKNEAKHTAPTMLADVIFDILSKKEPDDISNRRQSVVNLKSATKLLNFLTANAIKDMPTLEEKFAAMSVQLDDVRNALKKFERRKRVLDEHIRQSEIYLEHKALSKQHKQIPNPHKRDAFFEAHRAELILFEAAQEYLLKVMNGHTTLPVKAWRAERARLADGLQKLNQAYVKLKEEVHEVEQIRRGVENIMRTEMQATREKNARRVEI